MRNEESRSSTWTIVYCATPDSLCSYRVLRSSLIAPLVFSPLLLQNDPLGVLLLPSCSLRRVAVGHVVAVVPLLLLNAGVFLIAEEGLVVETLAVGAVHGFEGLRGGERGRSEAGVR